ncbi:MAG: hypothetical protein K6G04_07585 [Lachnospiraceae bacterium]|nr:hypothetical protein [Lachnospiraceae bacterium]
MKNVNRYPVNGFRLCVDDTGEKLCGWVHTPLQKEAIAFHGLEEVLLKMDEVFDRVGYPQAFQERRSFVKSEESNLYHGIPKACIEDEQMLGFRGKVDTIDVVVTSRRNSSWQGEMYDADGAHMGSFDGDMDWMELLVHKI